MWRPHYIVTAYCFVLPGDQIITLDSDPIPDASQTATPPPVSPSPEAEGELMLYTINI